MAPSTHAGLNIALEGGHKLYRFANTLEGVKSAIAHAKAKVFAKEYCTVLSDEEAASYQPYLPKYQPKNERYKRTLTKGRGMPKPPAAKPTGMTEAQFREEWSVYLQHGKITLEQEGGFWVMTVEGHGQSAGKDLGLLSMCLENIEMSLTGKSASWLKAQRDMVRKAQSSPNAKRIAAGKERMATLASSHNPN
jgi:hypothetical protein